MRKKGVAVRIQPDVSKNKKIKKVAEDNSKEKMICKYKPKLEMDLRRHIRQFSNDREKFDIPKLSFQRLVKGIREEMNLSFRMEVAALSALHEAAESFLINLFANSALCCNHVGRVTLKPKDIHLAMTISGIGDGMSTNTNNSAKNSEKYSSKTVTLSLEHAVKKARGKKVSEIY